jgi:hypothetical protein
MNRLPVILAAHLSLSVLVSTPFHTVMADQSNVGPLDRPLSLPGDDVRDSSVLSASSEENPIQSLELLQAAVEAEQAELEQLPGNELQARAEQGERAAMVALANDFAGESALLAFSPTAANDALSDAVRLYSNAASRGFPGAASLDLAGIRIYPIRIQREPHP